MERYLLNDDGTYPNNARLPLLVYPGAFSVEADLARLMEETFAHNGWAHGWRNGVLGAHHYHSTAHEVLGCYRGKARIQFGGPEGVVVDVEAGDVAVLPAGLAHKNLGTEGDFRVVGCYPDGQTFDMNYGRVGERPAADRNIAEVRLPEADPVYGREGPLTHYWLP